MKVYTRTGDEGQTSLFNGERVAKNHWLVEAYGTVDECNSSIGLATSLMKNLQTPVTDPKMLYDLLELIGRLQTIQQYLFDLGAHLATPRNHSRSSSSKIQKTRFSPNASLQLEQWIDEMDPKLPKLTTFVLPGGSAAAAALHQARTIARRAERNVTPLMITTQSEDAVDEPKAQGKFDVNGNNDVNSGEEKGRTEQQTEQNIEGDEERSEIDPSAYRFLNRLSDFLFVASRFTNHVLGCEDITWSPLSTSSENTR